MSQTKIEKVSYRGWSNCYRLSNERIELIVTSEVGPRIIHLGFVGGQNLFGIFDEYSGKTGGDKWIIYGGHRLWHSPEDKVRTYEPDNAPVDVQEMTNGLRLTQKVEPRTGIKKSIEVTLDPVRAEVRLVHQLVNSNLWAIRLAAWALTMMEQGGFAIVPLPARYHADFLLPNRTITLWPYTDMRDSRYLWGKDYVLLRQSTGKEPTKIGVNDNDNWVAYYLEPYLFVKRFQYAEGADYPDYGSSVEVYTNARMLELETVGPLRLLQPGEGLVHEERWELYKGVKLEFSEEDVQQKVLSLLKSK
ncbi:DUF4380 domain-containing protein [Acidobacteria bacterium AH-259-L09]|nr:DUF4380 domain-containing protein [Acidobacteria bacterium AH-259-L09]